MSAITCKKKPVNFTCLKTCKENKHPFCAQPNSPHKGQLNPAAASRFRQSCAVLRATPGTLSGGHGWDTLSGRRGLFALSHDCACYCADKTIFSYIFKKISFPNNNSFFPFTEGFRRKFSVKSGRYLGVFSKSFYEIVYVEMLLFCPVNFRKATGAALPKIIAQPTPLKGKRFESIEEQNAYLQSWESKWAEPLPLP